MLKQTVIFAVQIVASLMMEYQITMEYQIISAHTHTHRRMHPCTHARRSTHAPSTHTHKVVVVGGTHILQQTIFLPTISKYSHTGLLKGLDLLEPVILYDRDT